MAEKRQHHYIPQFYLQGFTDPDTPPAQMPWLWVLDWNSGTVKRRAPKNVAASRGFYAIHNRNGDVDYEQVEDELAEVEGAAAGELRNFLRARVGAPRGITPEIGVFLSWLAARVPWFVRCVSEQWAKFLLDAASGRGNVPDDPSFEFSLSNSTTNERRSFCRDAALDALRTGQWSPRLDQDSLVS